MIQKRLFIFDMDGTLIPTTTAAVEISKVTGHLHELEELEKQWNSERIDIQGFVAYLTDLWAEISEETIRQAFQASPKLKNIPEALSAIKDIGGISCLMTMSGDFFAHFFYDYGFDYIFASSFPIPKGRSSHPYILKPEDKPVIAEQLCQIIDTDFNHTVAFGDSISDFPLFKRLQHTVAVNGNEKIKGLAKHIYDGEDLLEALSLVLKA